MSRLDRLLRIRRACEGLERGRWARARQEWLAKSGEAEAIVARREHVSEDVRTRLTGDLDLARVAFAAECKEALGLGLRRAEEKVRVAQEETESRPRELESAHREVRALEKLTEKSAAAERARRDSAEARERDDRPREGEQP